MAKELLTHEELIGFVINKINQGGGGGAAEIFETCSASEYDEDGVPIYDELIKRFSASVMPQKVFLVPSKTVENHSIGWRWDTTYEAFDPWCYVDVILANILLASDHKSNETALTFKDADGNSTTVYVHTENE